MASLIFRKNKTSQSAKNVLITSSLLKSFDRILLASLGENVTPRVQYRMSQLRTKHLLIVDEVLPEEKSKPVVELNPHSNFESRD